MKLVTTSHSDSTLQKATSNGRFLYKTYGGEPWLFKTTIRRRLLLELFEISV